MKDLRDLKDLTIHDVKPISDEFRTNFHKPEPSSPVSENLFQMLSGIKSQDVEIRLQGYLAHKKPPPPPGPP